MKKIIVCVMILMSLFSMSVFANGSAPTVTLSEDQVVKPGDNVTIEIKVEIPSNTKIQGIQVDFEYSEDFPEIDSSKTIISKNTTTWTNIGITEKNMVAFGNVNRNATEVIGKLSFKVPDIIAGDKDYILKITEAVAATSTEEVQCTLNKKSVLIKVRDDKQPSSSVNQNGNSTGSTAVIPEEPINNNKPEDVTSQKEVDEFLGFEDVLKSDWFYESVKFVKRNNLMSGTSQTQFAPNTNLTRGMLVTILYRIENNPQCGEPEFLDVEKNLWYSSGVAWAAENGIVNGIGNGLFGPNNNITREQIAVILYNYTKFNKIELVNGDDLRMFIDKSEVSDWAIDGVQWAVAEKLISGKGDGILDPKGNATRAEIATILKRYIENVK